MSTVRGYNLDVAYASAKGENADLIRLKIRQAQDLLKEIDALELSLHNLPEKQISRDRYRNMRVKYLDMRDIYQKWQSEMRWREEWEKWDRKYGRHFEEENYVNHVEPTIGDQDELIRNLKFKLLQKSNSLAEEKKLIRHIKEAEVVRDTLIANPKPEVHRANDTKETSTDLVHQAKLQKMMRMEKVLGDLDSVPYKMSSFEKVQIQIKEKRRQLYKIVYDVVQLQEQETTS